MYILHQFIIHIMEGYICLFFFYYVCFSCTENLLEISKQKYQPSNNKKRLLLLLVTSMSISSNTFSNIKYNSSILSTLDISATTSFSSQNLY